MSTKKGKKAGPTTDPNVPLLKPTVTGKSSGKPAAKSWKDWEEEDAHSDRTERRSADKSRKSRQAMASLLRLLCLTSAIALVLSQQPFLARPRAPGVNKIKAAPVPVLLAGGLHFARQHGVPEVRANATLNTVGRALLFPHKYFQGRASKRASDSDKSFAAAWRKTKAALEAALQADPAVSRNSLMVAGSALCVAGSVLALAVPGAEFAPVLGAVLMFNGGRQSGLEPQPELFALGIVCVMAITCADWSRPAAAKGKRKKA